MRPPSHAPKAGMIGYGNQLIRRRFADAGRDLVLVETRRAARDGKRRAAALVARAGLADFAEAAREAAVRLRAAPLERAVLRVVAAVAPAVRVNVARLADAALRRAGLRSAAIDVALVGVLHAVDGRGRRA